MYGIIVTYKEYLIGDCKRFWNQIIGDEVKKKCQELGIDICVSSENLFFVSIDDFDHLMAGVKENSVSVSSVLHYVAERNADSITRCLVLKQHLSELWDSYYRPDFLKERATQTIDEITQTFYG